MDEISILWEEIALTTLPIELALPRVIFLLPCNFSQIALSSSGLLILMAMQEQYQYQTTIL